MNIYFENIKLYHYPFLMYFLARKYNVYIFDFDQSMRKKKWLRHFVHNKKITNISPYVQGNDSLALDSVDRVYASTVQKSPLLNAMIRLYDDSNIEMGFKKVLAKQLSHFYTIQIILRKTDQKRALLIPFKNLEVLTILEKCQGSKYKLDCLRIPVWAAVLSVIHRAFTKIFNLMLLASINVFLLGSVLLKLLFKSRGKEKRHYQYALPITNPSFQFKFNKQRTFDFLLDGNGIRKENCVFLWLNVFDKQKAENLRLNGYNVLDCTKRNVYFSREFGLDGDEKILLKKLIRFSCESFMSCLFEHDFSIRASAILAHTNVYWNIVLNTISVGHFITFNDEMIRHIGRNILINQTGAQTWYYVHSNSFEYLYAKDEADFAKLRYWLWTYLHYDHYISWSDKMTEFQKLHHQEVKNYHNTGCIWSTFIAQSDATRNINEYLHQHNVMDKHVMKGTKIISFFDTSFFDGIASLYPLKDGIKFYEDIARLLTEMPHVFIIVKEKKSRQFYLDKSSFQYSHDSEEYVRVMNKVTNLPNCYFAGYGADPADIIKVSDLTVTYAFSSSSVEALAVPQMAIFYDPAEHFRDSYYAQIPGLVAHGYEELKAIVNNLLYETSKEEYDQYLKENILHQIDDYLDAQALTRVRNLLVGRSEPILVNEDRAKLSEIFD